MVKPFKSYMKWAARRQADLVYSDMISCLKVVQRQDPALRPCGMTGAFVLLRHRAYKPLKEGDVLNFVMKGRDPGWVIRIDPNSSYNEFIENVALIEYHSAKDSLGSSPADDEYYYNMHDRLKERFAEGELILGQSIEEQHNGGQLRSQYERK